MVGKGNDRCSKCGIYSKENSSLTFHRFPLPSARGSLKARVWAKFCFPNDDWSSDESLMKLYKKHKLLCSNHFDVSSFTSSAKIRLNKFAIPTQAQNILAQLRDEQPYKKAQKTQGTTQMQTDVQVTASTTSQCSTSIEHSNENSLPSPDLTTYQKTTQMQINVEVMASTSQCSTSIGHSNEYKLPIPDLTKESSKRKGILKGLNVTKVTELTPREQKLYKICRKNLTEILRLRRKFRNFKKCFRDVLHSLHYDKAVNNMMKSKLSNSSYLLLQSQLKNVSRKLIGRRLGPSPK